MRIAVIDDDPMETVLLSEIAKDVGPHFAFEAFASIEAFLETELGDWNLVFLDRRLPPHTEFSETLPRLAEAGFANTVVLMTAHDPGIEIDAFAFQVIGPVDKLDLLQPEILGPILNGASSSTE